MIPAEIRGRGGQVVSGILFTICQAVKRCKYGMDYPVITSFFIMDFGSCVRFARALPGREVLVVAEIARLNALRPKTH